MQKRKQAKSARFSKKSGYSRPVQIEIDVDGEGKIWFVSSAPLFEKEKRPNDRLCG